MAMTIFYPVGQNLYVNLTNQCPCSCTFCIRQNGDGAYGSDSLWLEHTPTFEEVQTACPKDLGKYHEIVFCGYGEPTEALDVLCQTAAYLKQQPGCPPLRINTNGLSDLIHGAPTAHRFQDLIDTVSISLNAPNAEEYDKVTRPSFPNAYAAMLDFAEECGRLMKHTQLSIVDVLPQEDIDACQKIADERGVHLKVRKFSKGA